MPNYFEYLTSVSDVLDQLPLGTLEKKIRQAIEDAGSQMTERDRDLEDFLDGTWVVVDGVGTAAVGSAPVLRSGFGLQAGSDVITATAGGAQITFPSSFTSGVLTVVACMGASTTNGPTVEINSPAVSGFKAKLMTGATEITTGSYTVNWLAIGF